MKYENLIIRHETKDDHKAVEALMREAFWNLYRPGCEEHFIAHTMRKHPDFIPELSFVLEENQTLIGSIIYSRSQVIDKAGKAHPLITFGPVAIAPAKQRQGFGRLLITHSIEAAKKLGHRAIMIGGFPYHYHGYGFVGAKKYKIAMPDGVFYTGIMALPLFEGALNDISGEIHFSPSLYVDFDAAEAFDQQFPYKEKQVLPAQAAFEKACAEIDLA